MCIRRLHVDFHSSCYAQCTIQSAINPSAFCTCVLSKTLCTRQVIDEMKHAAATPQPSCPQPCTPPRVCVRAILSKRCGKGVGKGDDGEPLHVGEGVCVTGCVQLGGHCLLVLPEQGRGKVAGWE